MGSKESEVNGGMKKWVERWPKREELLRNCFKEEIGLLMTDTGHREAVKLEVQAAKRMEDWRWESDWGMISRVTKRCFGKR